MYLLSVRYTPNEYRYVGYIPIEHSSCSQPENLVSTGLYSFSVRLSQLLMYHLKKKKISFFFGAQSGVKVCSKF